jgi:cation-transporting ATPase E
METPYPGLTANEVAARRAAGEGNRPPSNNWREYVGIFSRNTFTLFNFLIVPAAAVLFLLRDFRGAWAVSSMALANMLIALTHEFRVKRLLDRLNLLGEAKICVRRDQREETISAGEVVRGDVVLIRSGDTVVADGTVVRSEFLEMDESLLTGEADSIARDVGEPLLSGSSCVGGEGEYLADRVGGESFAHRMAATARKYRFTTGPTQHTLNQLVRWLSIVAVLLCLGYVGLYYTRGFETIELVQMVAATITSMVPQGLVLMTTLVFVLGAIRLSNRGVLVQRLAAIESMAVVDVICTDKTGTLTTGRQTVDRLIGFNEPEPTIKRWLATFATFGVDRSNKSIEALRDYLATDSPIPGRVIDQLPFRSQNRFSAIQFESADESRLLVLGAFETLRDHFSEADRTHVETAWRECLPTGLRLIIFASCPAANQTLDARLLDVALRPLALIGLRDQLRPEAVEVLAELASQGIQFKVVSGDHPETVRATVRTLGATFAGAHLVTGDEWTASPDQAEVADRTVIFGRMLPEQKLALVEILQKRGRHVGMIGDGVNDILPIKRAEFGVAMGSGSQATKAAAAMVLESNEFAALPAVLVEGRNIIQNVRLAAKLFLVKNVYTVAFILIAVGLFDLPFPYLPQQVTLLNALTIGGPVMLILARRSSHPPRIQTTFFKDVGPFVFTAGAATSVVGLFVYLYSSLAANHPPDLARTLLLGTLTLAGVGNAVTATGGDRWLWLWAVVAAVLFVVVTLIPPVSFFFAFVPLSALQWGLTVVLAALAVAPTILLVRLGQPR